jgi:hypothetical protein
MVIGIPYVEIKLYCFHTGFILSGYTLLICYALYSIMSSEILAP